MNKTEQIRTTTRMPQCSQQKNQLVKELCALSDHELSEIGAWRGGIDETAKQILSGIECEGNAAA